MTSKTKVFCVIAFAIVFGTGLLGSYQWGHRKGEAIGRDRGYAAGRVYGNIDNCVYLTLSFREEAKGDDVAARDLRYRLLYGSAVELDAAIDAELVTNKSRERAQGVVEEVVAHYWANPQTTSFLDREEWLRGLVEEKLDTLFEKFRSSEQGGARQPSTRPESKGE